MSSLGFLCCVGRIYTRRPLPSTNNHHKAKQETCLIYSNLKNPQKPCLSLSNLCLSSLCLLKPTLQASSSVSHKKNPETRQLISTVCSSTGSLEFRTIKHMSLYDSHSQILIWMASLSSDLQNHQSMVITLCCTCLHSPPP